MADDTFQYITRPTSDGSKTTTGAKYRGTKTPGETIAEVTARLGSSALSVPLVITTFHQVVIDWTIAGWKVDPLEDLIGYLCTCGGSQDLGAVDAWDFDTMNITLNGHYGSAGQARARAAFSAEKVGEQSRVVPVFSKVYDSLTQTADHYVPAKQLVCEMSNRNGKFDPSNTDHRLRLSMGGENFDCTDYYVRGMTIVGTVAASISAGGPAQLSISMLINGSLRTGIYSHLLT